MGVESYRPAPLWFAPLACRFSAKLEKAQKHSVSSTRDKDTKMMMGVMEVVDFNAYDLKYLSKSDISYNPALGTGQIQIKDTHYVTIKTRTAWEFCQLLDKKFVASKKGYRQWLEYAEQNEWIK